jgi:hypothetical protein
MRMIEAARLTPLSPRRQREPELPILSKGKYRERFLFKGRCLGGCKKLRGQNSLLNATDEMLFNVNVGR